jgi:cytochrome c oxidase assembly protein subunit 11
VPGGVHGAANSQVDLTRTITVEFDANARGPWEFKPAQAHLQVHPGQLATVMYEFQNVQDPHGGAGHPQLRAAQAAPHFNKLECFCFNQYTLEPGEKKQWPVAFVIDPKLPKDVTTITLSYTFFEVGGKTPPAPVGGRLPSGDRAAHEARAVAWRSGIRRGEGLEGKLKHVILVALVGVALIVVGLVSLVHWIV